MDNGAYEKFYGQPENCYFASGEPPYSVRLDANGRREQVEFEDFDSCFLWALHRLMLGYRGPEEVEDFEVQIVDDTGFTLSCDTVDSLVENVWKTMTDLPFSYDDKLECEWFVFDEGADREDIMALFDLWYSKGAKGLREKFD